MSAPSIGEILKYADLQMAAEAFLTTKNPPFSLRSDLLAALTEGNNRSSKFTETQATDFLANWEVVAQQPNTETGFSGTLFRQRQDDSVTGAKVGDLVMSFRSTEFLDDAVRDNQATNTLEVKNMGWALGLDYQLAALRAAQFLSPSAGIVGISLNSHEAAPAASRASQQFHPHLGRMQSHHSAANAAMYQEAA